MNTCIFTGKETNNRWNGLYISREVLLEAVRVKDEVNRKTKERINSDEQYKMQVLLMTPSQKRKLWMTTREVLFKGVKK